MYYVMRVQENCPTRIGRMFKSPEPAVRLAAKTPNAYVEKYGVGVVWTPKMSAIH